MSYVYETADFRRIRDLPRRVLGDATALKTKWKALLGTSADSCKCVQLGRACCSELNTVQAQALEEMSIVGGLLGPIGVGHGKTLICLLAARAVPNVRWAVLLVPPQLKAQLEKVDIPFYSQHWKLPENLTIVAYSTLSTAKGTNLLQTLKPDLYVLDEAHLLRNTTAVRTKRFRQTVKNITPDARGVAVTGTFIRNSVRDVMPMAAFTLRQGSPWPLWYPDQEMWARALDPVPEGEPMGPGCLIDLAKEGESVQSAVQRRVIETPGVVTSGDATSCQASLIIRAIKFDLSATTIKMIRDVRDSWVRPDGEELVTYLDVARCQRALAVGFYHYREWVKGESKELQREWLDARSEWVKECRTKTRRIVPFMDSELLLYLAASRYYEGKEATPTAPTWNSQTWKRWSEIRKKTKPVTRYTWAHHVGIQHVGKWLGDGQGLVWTEFPEFGVTVSRELGLTFFGGPEGSSGLESFAGKQAALSLGACKAGFNLQRWDRHLVTTPPSSGADWEQLLGRSHRQGQLSDEVTFDVWQHTEGFLDSIDRARDLSLFIQQQFGSEQKLVNKAQWIGFNQI